MLAPQWTQRSQRKPNIRRQGRQGRIMGVNGTQSLSLRAGQKPVSRKSNALLVIPRTSSRRFWGSEGTRNLNRFKVNTEIPHSFQEFGMTTEANDKLLLLFPQLQFRAQTMCKGFALTHINSGLFFSVVPPV